MILMDRCRVDTRVSFVQNSREFHAKRVSYFAKKYYLFREIPVSRNCILACETKRNSSNLAWLVKQKHRSFQTKIVVFKMQRPPFELSAFFN